MRARRSAAALLGAAFALLDLLARGRAPAAAAPLGATITVNSTADVINGSDNLCTLREAIIVANTNSPLGLSSGECAVGTTGLDTITFDPTVFNGNKTITITTSLPDITAPVVITGDAPWFASSSLIKVADSFPSPTRLGFTFAKGSAGSVLNRLVVDHLITGVELDGGGVTVTNCRIGVDFNSNVAAADLVGIGIFSSNNVIGGINGSGVPVGNVISGNSSGIQVTGGTKNVIQSNFIGTAASGFGSVPNNVGVALAAGASSTLIGGTNGQGNVISGNNAGAAIGIDIDGAKSTKIVGNLIGIAADGVTADPNGFGVYDDGGIGTVIGGAMPQASNFFAHNTNEGIVFADAVHEGSATVIGNIIGRDVTGAPAGNSIGIIFASAPVKTTVKGNLISANTEGISVSGGTPMLTVAQNCFFGNTTAVVSGASEPLNVHGNWWGSPGGPNGAGGDPFTGMLTVTPFLTKPPTSCLGYSPKSVKPKDQSAFDKTTKPTTISWSKVPNAANYEFDLSSPFSTTGDVTTPGFSPGVLEYGVYQWHLVVGAPPAVAWVTPTYTFYVTIQKSPKPNAIVVPKSSDAVAFSWGAFPGASSYNFTYYNAADCGGAAFATNGVTATSITQTGLTSGFYGWTVKPDNGPLMPCQPFSIP